MFKVGDRVMAVKNGGGYRAGDRGVLIEKLVYCWLVEFEGGNTTAAIETNLSLASKHHSIKLNGIELLIDDECLADLRKQLEGLS